MQRSVTDNPAISGGVVKMNTKAQSNRGGKRAGAGRKAAPDNLKRETITIRLPRWLIDKLPADRRGDLITKAVAKHLLVKPPKE